MAQAAPVVAVAVNTCGLLTMRLKRRLTLPRSETGLPVTDPVRFGAGPLLDALLAYV